MRRHATLLVLGTVLISGLISGNSLAGPRIIDPAQDQARPEDLPQIQILSSDERGVSLLFELPALEVEEVAVGAETYKLVTIPGGGETGAIGAPTIPTFSRLVMIPDRAAVQVSAMVEAQEDLAGYRLIPMQGEDGSGFAVDREAYSVNRFGGSPGASAGRSAILRDLRVVPLTFRPVDYNPASGTLRVASRIRVDIRFEGTDLENERSSKRTSLPPSFDQLYRSLVLNYQDPPAGLRVVQGTYLLICPNSSAVITRLQPLIDWRTRKGQAVRLATTAETGTSREQIKSFIQGVYDSADPPLEYVCLVGDATGSISLPCWFETLSGYGGEGDHPYTQLEGGDVLADVHIGRLSVTSNTEVEVVVNKIIGYESTPYTQQDAGWFKRACLVGDPGASGYSTVQVQQWIKTRLRQLGSTEIDTIYSSPFVSQMTTALNKGDGLFSYRGYYQMSGWGNSNTYALTNGWKMPFVVTITCDTGSFSDDVTCRTEGFLRANSGANAPRGGIGAIGTATIGTHTRFNNCVHYGICYGLLYEGLYTMGAALTRGKMELYLNYQTAEPNRVIIWSYWNNLMGDPAVDCWTGFPEALTVQHAASLPVGANAVTVTVRKGGLPEPDAQVCLWKGSETYVVGQTDSEGRIELPVSTPSAGNMLVTVTKHDRYPYQGTIAVAGQQQFVGLQSTLVDDDANGESLGNGNGQANPGESIELRVQLKNFGTQTAPAVSATLTTEDPYVTLLDGSETFGDIPPGGTAWTIDDFGLAIDQGCPNDHVVRLGLDVTSGANAWHSLIDLPVVAGDLVWDGVVTFYNAGGNNRLDPGETVELSVKLRNQGGANATSPIATLLSRSQYVDVPDGQGSFGTIDAGGAGENTGDRFTVHADPATYEGYVAAMRLLLEFSGGTRDTADFTFEIGQRSSNDPLGPDRYGYYAFDNTDTAYPEAPTYGWIEIDPAFGGNGTEVVLGDYNDYQDKSKVVDIPFPFQYYGRVYTKATICSNGWVAMGSQWNTEYRNWTIPGAGGPQAMIAGFWDDLYQVAGSSKVLQKHDTANNRWIIEWSRMRNDVGGGTETFEVILYDPAFHETDTGDGIIEMQYETITNPDNVDHFATVGIENHDQDDGILYTFYNLYPTGAAPLQAGRAIRYIPKREVLTGLVYGTVRNQAGGGPISGAAVEFLENGHQYLTGANGTYAANETAGDYTLRASRDGFQPDTVSNVAVVTGGSIQIDFNLRDVTAPEITTSPAGTTNDTIGPYVITARIVDVSPISNATLYYRLNEGSFNATPLVNVGGSNYRAEIPGQPWTTKVEYYLYARDLASNEARDPANAPADLYVFFVAPTVTVYLDEMEEDGIWTAGAAGDNATAGKWVRADPNGTYWGAQLVQPEDDHTADPGVRCWVTGNGNPGDGQAMADVDGGKTTLVSGILFPPLQGEVFLRYYRWFSNDSGTNPAEDYWVVQISDDNGETWVDLERTKVSNRSWLLREFYLPDYIDTMGLVRIRFIAEDAAGPSIVEAAVDDVEVIFTGQTAADVAGSERHRFGLDRNAPNPFADQTRIGFSLEQAGEVRLSIFDVSGRLVRTLVQDERPAGGHEAIWNGRDERGNRVGSGIYVCRLEAGRASQTRKLILIQ